MGNTMSETIKFELNNPEKSARESVAFSANSDAPDATWNEEQLTEYAKSKLAASKEGERQSLLQAEKAAVELFWAGSALSAIREKKKEEKHGAWNAWKKRHRLASTTVNDAIRLFEGAQAPEALLGLGITAAKEKFVYPVKTAAEQEEVQEMAERQTPPKKSASRRFKPAKNAQSNSDQESTVDPEWSVESGSDSEVDSVAVTEVTPAAELEEIAQRLSEIAEAGEAWTQEDRNRMLTAAQTVEAAVIELFIRINRDIFPPPQTE